MTSPITRPTASAMRAATATAATKPDDLLLGDAWHSRIEAQVRDGARGVVRAPDPDARTDPGARQASKRFGASGGARRSCAASNALEPLSWMSRCAPRQCRGGSSISSHSIPNGWRAGASRPHCRRPRQSSDRPLPSPNGAQRAVEGRRKAALPCRPHFNHRFPIHLPDEYHDHINGSGEPPAVRRLDQPPLMPPLMPKLRA